MKVPPAWSALQAALPSARAASGDDGNTGVGTDSASLPLSPYLHVQRCLQ